MKDRVVGYGSWAVQKPERGINPRRLLAIGHGRLLLAMANSSIRHALKTGKNASVKDDALPHALKAQGAAFVTINLNGRLRGCIGSIHAHRPIGEDVVLNAYKAAFKDPRFEPLTTEEYQRAEVDISLLGPHTPFPVESEKHLIEGLQPGRDGLTLADNGKRALFLPAVWAGIKEPELFVRRLKQKAGWDADYWSEIMEVTRFDSEKISMASIKSFAAA
ncbi:MAG: AmmeMemoRadiSam system protein A [Rhodospirillaceae bacterium]|nr:AmmeMemoRadiSam system protein A [Rhodospirillaceae bacterium]